MKDVRRKVCGLQEDLSFPNFSRTQLRCEDVKSVLHKSIEIMVPTYRSTITNRIEACLIHFTPLVRNQAGGTCPLAFLKIWYN